MLNSKNTHIGGVSITPRVQGLAPKDVMHIVLCDFATQTHKCWKSKMASEDQQTKFAIHAACRDGQSQYLPHSLFSTTELTVKPLQRMRSKHYSMYANDSKTTTATGGGKFQEQPRLIHSEPQANPKLAKRRDDDDRLPIHWAASYNRLPIVELLSERKDFDVDAQVSRPLSYSLISRYTHTDILAHSRTARAGPA